MVITFCHLFITTARRTHKKQCSLLADVTGNVDDRDKIKMLI